MHLLKVAKKQLLCLYLRKSSPTLQTVLSVTKAPLLPHVPSSS